MTGKKSQLDVQTRELHCLVSITQESPLTFVQGWMFHRGDYVTPAQMTLSSSDGPLRLLPYPEGQRR